MTERAGPHCFAPVVGGGGDVVASEVRVKKFLERNFLRRSDPEVGGGGDIVASDFRVKSFFSRNNFSLRHCPRGQRRRLPKEGHLLNQPGLSAVPRIKARRSRGHKKSPGEARGFPLVSFPTIRLERGEYVDRTAKARSFSTPVLRGTRENSRLRDPGGKPVSERGGSIRSRDFVRKRLFLGGCLSRPPRIVERRAATRQPADI